MYSGTRLHTIEPSILTLNDYFVRRQGLVEKYPFLHTTLRPSVQSLIDDYGDGLHTEEQVVNLIMRSMDQELTNIADLIMVERRQEQGLRDQFMETKISEEIKNAGK